MYENRRRNTRRVLVRSFVARGESSSPSGVNLDMALRDSECQEKRIVLIRGVRKGSRSGRDKEKPQLCTNYGKYIAVLNDDGVVIKFRNEKQSTGIPFIGRQLKENEVLKFDLTKWRRYSRLQC